ncbi:hypothetical protein M011DRAFT_181645 [Sporormia fimetaria CBS 119925]|uniref:Uncharacterized protein n=1 Tax=Sporormia fimetaria CBS 119925 TaxID=1340428 RepID=A0A6A6VJC7_9PLEO|nr:hypothetical protein M011DRAFT_181645 [Sporormia fimetaria CBS 119925]
MCIVDMEWWGRVASSIYDPSFPPGTQGPGDGCTTFFNQKNCRGDRWRNVGSASTVPAFLNDNMWSFMNHPNGLCWTGICMLW